ncbi:ATPase, T2SS/T4P/T4SS family, partial [Pseudomonas aeruginosa]|uniref:ATPase, T2SS/T4P/T4SS family n=1 Tax=Pseudomonas aeruginosa TaxID=287 RepID=UPI003F7E1BA7
LRTGADLILICDIRDEDTAYQAWKASLNGNLVISTIHDKNCPQANERLITLGNPRASNASDDVAEAIHPVM